MKNNLIAKAAVTIDESGSKVWDALVNPAMIKQYLFGTTVVSDWHESSPIVWKGDWQGRSYKDKGTILQFRPERLLQYSHFSPLAGQEDIPENYHTVTIVLESDGQHTHVSLTQDKNATEEEREHSESHWKKMLSAIKALLEK